MPKGYIYIIYTNVGTTQPHLIVVEEHGQLSTNVGTNVGTKIKPTAVSAVHAFYYGKGIGTECPDYNITQHTAPAYKYRAALPISICILRIYAIGRRLGSRIVAMAILMSPGSGAAPARPQPILPARPVV